MKTMIKGPIRNEKGSALPLVLVLLVLGGLILAPLLGLMSTGLVSGTIYERKMDELYAADGGVEDAIWRLQTNNLTFDANNSSEPWHLTVNDKSVEVVVYREDLDPTPCGEDFTYEILSTATTGDGGGTADISSSTTIDAHIVPTPKYYPTVMDHLITIQHDVDDVKQLEDDLAKLNITCPEQCTECAACGQAYDYYTEYDEIPAGCKGCVAVYNFPALAWPTAESLNSTYWQDVKDGVSYDSPIHLQGQNQTLQPGYRNGTLSIWSSDNKQTLTLKLNGTLYVTGDTEVGSEKQDFVLDLNGHTIFVSSNSSSNTGSNALIIGGKCTLQGPGLIIAIGDIKFEPKAMIGGEQEPIFVLSVDGMTSVQPSGKWWGAVAGRTDVNIGQGSNPSTVYPADGFGDLAFPRMLAGWTYSIVSWEINPR